jgi:hypothetical protein
MEGHKTLDEVIKAGHICGRYVITDNATGEDTICDIVKKGFISDALHYLKEYQRYQNTPSRIGHMAMADLEKNEPLTWSELKQCEGKPIWIESYDPIDDKRGWHKAEWYLLQWCRDDEDPEWNMLYAINDGQEQCTYYLKDMGERWTAYRKERK